MAKKSTKSKQRPKSKQSGKKAELYKWLDNANQKYKLEKKLPLASVAILFITTIYWSLQSLVIQKNNADQLINPYLFDTAEVAKNALYASAHTFLFKWPIFCLIKLFNYSQPSYIALTLFVVIATLAGFVYLIYRIEKRPLYFSTLCLALASVLLMIPANPYPGGLLPVNMAMLATRNLEYLLFIYGLVALIKSKKFFDKYFIFSMLLMTLLFASDRLFLILSIGGGLITLVIFALLKYWRLVSLASMWLVSSLLSGILAGIILATINWSGLAIINGGTSSGPYSLVGSFNDLIIGTFYSFSGILTNVGANPAFDATTIKNYFDVLGQRIFSIGGLAYLINLAIFGAGLGAVWLLLRPIFKNKRTNNPVNQSAKLVYLLFSATLASILIFVLTDHYYAVDSRYLTIVLFTLFIAISASFAKQTLKSHKLLLADAVLLISIICGAIASHSVYRQQNSAYNDVQERNNTITKVISSKPVNTLLGDYWRVVPIKNEAKKRLNVSPLADCITPRNSLTSEVWYPDLTKHSFAYLLSFDKSLSDFPKCSLDQVIKTYGKPNSSIIISGTLDNPKELLLYYDHGTHKNIQNTPSQQASTIFPISPDELTGTICSVPTILNVVAHPDDDLLFINPDVQTDIDSGKCIRTVYLTAGDAGHGNYYWLSRQRGTQAAYSFMTGNKRDIWIEKTVKLNDKQFVTVASPRANSKIALIYMHLPDGNLDGEGFNATSQQSINKLISSKEKDIKSVDGQSNYDYQQIIDALTKIMQIYQPTELRTQSTNRGEEYPDHSDHNAVGIIATSAFKQFEASRFAGKITLPISYYLGYPIHTSPANLSADQIKNKTATFLIYAKYDGSICRDAEKCLQRSNYDLYVERQYTSDN